MTILSNTTKSGTSPADTADAGAIYMGRDWTEQGITIRYNYLHDIKGDAKATIRGIYLDDQASGVNIYGNIFYDVDNATDIGGGCDNHVENNLFVSCHPAVHIDGRHMPLPTVTRFLSAVPYQNEQWMARYPNLRKMVDDPLNLVARNTVRQNLSWPESG